MKKKLIAFSVIAALLISMLSMSSVFAAEEPVWIWRPAEDGYVTDDGMGTGEDAEDGSYTTFTTVEGTAEGYFYPGSAGGDLTAGGMDPIDTIATIALVKYRTTVPSSVNAQFAWHNGSAHDFKSFRYTGDGEWHFAIADLTTDTDSGAGPWTDAASINWFRFDFANNIAADQTYSVDVAYIALFESEEDAQAYAEADGGAVVPAPGEDEDQDGDGSGGTEEPAPPQTGDVSVIVAVAAAALVLTMLLKKKLAV